MTADEPHYSSEPQTRPVSPLGLPEDAPTVPASSLERPVGFEHVPADVIRVVFALGWITFALAQGGLEWSQLWAPGLFLFYALAALTTLPYGVPPAPRIYTTLTVDMLVIASLCYLRGSLGFGLVAFYFPMIAAHTWDRIPGTGLTSLLLSMGSYGAVLVLEYQGVLPPRAWGTSELPSLLSLAGLAWPAYLAMIGTYFIVRGSVRRTRTYMASENRLLRQERAVHERSRRLQAKLVESQRLESLARLAGGIAHDFNNLLTGILGFSQVVQEDMAPGDPRRADLEEVVRAARRAREMTRDLLTFSRKQPPASRALDLDAHLAGLERMLGRLIGEAVTLHLHHGLEGGSILADPTHVEQVVVNLVVNARDAMPRGGRLELSTEWDRLDSERADALGLSSGVFAVLRVTDTGVGMDEALLGQIFDPFFTTKAEGEGTGLGLATVFGILRQGGGAVEVKSSPGEGATFTVYWPHTDVAPAPEEAERDVEASAHERVLVVEDEDIVRQLAVRFLERAGYSAHGAATFESGLETLRHLDEPPQLLLADLVLPDGAGADLALAARSIHPDVRVLYMSGYPGTGELDAPFLAKPFTRYSLLAKVRETLDAEV